MYLQSGGGMQLDFHFTPHPSEWPSLRCGAATGVSRWPASGPGLSLRSKTLSPPQREEAGFPVHQLARSQPAAFFHPKTPNRIAVVETVIAQWGGGTQTVFFGPPGCGGPRSKEGPVPYKHSCSAGGGVCGIGTCCLLAQAVRQVWLLCDCASKKDPATKLPTLAVIASNPHSFFSSLWSWNGVVNVWYFSQVDKTL